MKNVSCNTDLWILYRHLKKQYKTTTSFYFLSMLSVVHFLKYNLSWGDTPLLLFILLKEWEKKERKQRHSYTDFYLTCCGASEVDICSAESKNLNTKRNHLYPCLCTQLEGSYVCCPLGAMLLWINQQDLHWQVNALALTKPM